MQPAFSPAHGELCLPDRGWRLGRIEAGILDEIRRRGGIAPRCALVESVFPKVARRPPQPARTRRERERLERWQSKRADAESTISRAITSLARKGLIDVQRGPMAGRILIQASGLSTLPPWEESARTEDMLAREWQRIGTRLLDLSTRARRRAVMIRVAGVDDGHAAERSMDVQAFRDACSSLFDAGRADTLDKGRS